MTIPRKLDNCIPTNTSTTSFKAAANVKMIPVVLETRADAERAIEAALSGKVLKGATPHIGSTRSFKH